MGAVWNIAATTVGEAIRRRVLLVILMIGVLLLTIIPSLSVLSARSDDSVTVGTMFAVMRGTSALLAIVLTVYMIPNEIERRTIYTILSKPVQRWQFFLGKYLGAVLSLLLMITLMTVFMLVVYAIFQNHHASRLLSLAQQPVMYWIEMSLLAAVAICISTFVTPLINIFLSFGVWLVGTVLNPLYDTIANNSKSIPIMKSISKLIVSLVPNFADYDTKNPLINPGQPIQNQGLYYFTTIFYGVVWIALLLIIGALIFDRREV